MEEKLVIVKHEDLKGKTLTVPKEISENGKLILDEKGQATLPSKAAHFLCTVPGFSIVGESKQKVAATLEEEKQQTNTTSDELTNKGTETAKYPEGNPAPSWNKEELAAWLEERKVEFKPKDNEKVLLGKAFKFLEGNNEPNE